MTPDSAVVEQPPPPSPNGKPSHGAGPRDDGRGVIRVVRVIARLNIGGPAIQAITLTHLLDGRGYATTLVRGREEPDEGNMDYLAERLGVRPQLIQWLRRKPGLYDLRALLGAHAHHAGAATGHRPHTRREGRNARALGGAPRRRGARYSSTPSTATR